MNPRTFRPWRRMVQTGIALAFIAIPVLNSKEINILSGNFLSFNFAGLPLADPLASLQVMAGVVSATPAMLIGMGIALLLAALMGPVFCAWICPYGLLSELLHRERVSQDTKNVPPMTGRSFAGKALLVLTGLLAVVFFLPVPGLNQLSMPGWYSRAIQHAVLYREALWGAVIMIPAVLLAERISGRRFWCRYICPQSVLIALAGLVLPGRFGVRFAPKACTCPASDRSCMKTCSLNLNPRKQDTAQRLQCTNCGDCIDACKKRGRALSFGFGERQ